MCDEETDWIAVPRDHPLPIASAAHADLRLMAMTAMASTLAHELVQPLTAAINFLQASARRLRKDEAALESIELVDRSTKQIVKAIDLIRRMRGFALEGKVRGQRESLRQMIERVKADLVVQDRLAGELEVALNADAAYVLVDRIQIELVLTNLIVNAIESGPGQGEGRIEITSRLHDGQVEVSVRDFGEGITADEYVRLFDPLFTTKPHGTGLGLPICRAIVEAHGGRLWADSPNPSGAVFHFTLPTGELLGA